jgi:hypothetical protein
MCMCVCVYNIQNPTSFFSAGNQTSGLAKYSIYIDCGKEGLCVSQWNDMRKVLLNTVFFTLTPPQVPMYLECWCFEVIHKGLTVTQFHLTCIHPDGRFGQKTKPPSPSCNSFTNCTAVDLASQRAHHPSGLRAKLKRPSLSCLMWSRIQHFKIILK